MLLDRGDSSYSQLLAATTLTKLVSRNVQGLNLQQRVDIRNYVLNYLATRLNLQTFVVQALVTLLAKITKYGWFDLYKEQYFFRNLVESVKTFLQVSSRRNSNRFFFFEAETTKKTLILFFFSFSL